jgi:CRP/FNR family cyclic AMP-dependent transcriptional regulator
MFDLEAYLESTAPSREIRLYEPAQVIFSQGDSCTEVRYIQSGVIKLSVLSSKGKEAVVGMLTAGDFFGEAALAGQPVRLETATAVQPSRVRAIDREAMVKLLHDQPAFSDRFIAHMLARNARIEADLVDQLFNSSEKRLARTLLLMARYGELHPQRAVPPVTQETLAKIVGTTRSRVNFFMNKFRKLGLIEYNGALKVNPSLLSVILHD